MLQPMPAHKNRAVVTVAVVISLLQHQPNLASNLTGGRLLALGLLRFARLLRLQISARHVLATCVPCSVAAVPHAASAYLLLVLLPLCIADLPEFQSSASQLVRRVERTHLHVLVPFVFGVAEWPFVFGVAVQQRAVSDSCARRVAITR
jgi:hypothetical protein